MNVSHGKKKLCLKYDNFITVNYEFYLNDSQVFYIVCFIFTYRHWYVLVFRVNMNGEFNLSIL